MKKALINKIIPFSCVDGPGNRMAIFFQGCSFRCGTCHNPETINICNNCGICVPHCPSGALSVSEGLVQWEQQICENCDTCLAVCQNLSTPKGRSYDLEELYEEIHKASPFISGITCSGGECLVQADFIESLFSKLKSNLLLSCLVDTNGYTDLSKRTGLVELTDGFMLDVKSTNLKEHLELTGESVDMVLKNLDYLLRMNKVHEVRTVIIPGNENLQTVKKVASIIGNTISYKLIPYHSHGVRKGGISRYGKISPSKEMMDNLLAEAKACGADKVSIIDTLL